MDWKAIRSEFETTEVTLKALAEKYDVKPGTLKSRKSREQWQRDATESTKVATSDQDAPTTTKLKPIEVAELENLTEKQLLFCMHYLKTFNATQSAIKAGYSADRAHAEGHHLLRNANISDYIRELKSDITEDLFLDTRDIPRKYVAIAFGGITDFMTFGKKEIEAIFIDTQKT